MLKNVLFELPTFQSSHTTNKLFLLFTKEILSPLVIFHEVVVHLFILDHLFLTELYLFSESTSGDELFLQSESWDRMWAQEVPVKSQQGSHTLFQL